MPQCSVVSCTGVGEAHGLEGPWAFLGLKRFEERPGDGLDARSIELVLGVERFGGSRFAKLMHAVAQHARGAWAQTT